MNLPQQKIPEKLWTSAFIRIGFLNLALFMGFHMLTATFPFYIKNLGGDEAIAGLAAGLFATSAVLVRPVVGWILDHAGRKIILAIGLIGMIVMPISYIVIALLTLAIILRIVQGLIWSCASTAANTAACDIVPRTRFGEGMGIFSTGPAISMAFGPLLGISLMTKSGFTSLFIVAATFGVLAFVLVIGVKDIALPKQKHRLDHRRGLENLIEKNALPASVTMLLFIMPFGAITTFVALYAVEIGIISGGIFFTIMALTTVVIRLSTSRFIDRRGEAPTVFISNACAALSLILLAVFPGNISFILAALFFGLGLGMMQPAMQTMAMRIVPVHRRGAASSTFLCAFDIGIGLGSAIAGYLIRFFDYYTTFFSMVFFLIICQAIYYFWAGKSPSSFKNSVN